jgi:hypothetical protein
MPKKYITVSKYHLSQNHLTLAFTISLLDDGFENTFFTVFAEALRIPAGCCGSKQWHGLGNHLYLLALDHRANGKFVSRCLELSSPRLRRILWICRKSVLDLRIF